MTEDREVLRHAAAWVRGMADAARHVLKQAPNPAAPIPISPEEDIDVVLAGRPTGCGPNVRLLTCFLPPGEASEGCPSLDDVRHALERVVTVADALCEGLDAGGLTPELTRKVRAIVQPPAR
jgi:hypothetical protein